MVKAVCQRILGDAALAEDAAQEVFLLFVRKLPSLSPRTSVGGWLYVTACHLAQTHRRTLVRRLQRETRPDAMAHLMKPNENTLWRELEPLLDEAMLTLSQRQRELVLLRYFQNNSQRSAAVQVGCSESVASRELSAAVESLRTYFARNGVAVSATILVTLLSANGAKATMAVASFAASLSSASALADASAAGGSLIFTIMNMTTMAKILAGAALIIASGAAIHHFTRPPAPDLSAAQSPTDTSSPRANVAKAEPSSRPEAATRPLPTASNAPVPGVRSKGSSSFPEEVRKAAREKQAKFIERLTQLAIIKDPHRVQELLAQEYGIRLPEAELSRLLESGPKGFTFGVVEAWGSTQPQDALAWAASMLSDPAPRGGWSFQQSVLQSAIKALPNLNLESLEAMLPDGPGKAQMLDLFQAVTNPASLANSIAADPNAADRASRLALLAQGWSDAEAAFQWAQQNLSGTDRQAFYGQIGYNLAHQNPQEAFQALAELQGTDSYASTMGSMMRGLVQEGGQGAAVAALIDNAGVTPEQRADLISELARRWVRSDPEAAINWANELTAPEDVRSAIPLLVSQLSNDRVTSAVDAYLASHDPVMEAALIEAAAPPGLRFDPDKSRLILDPIISQDPTLKLTAGEGNGGTIGEMLWNSVNQTAKLQAESGAAAAAMDWLAKLPFASEADYTRAVGNVYSVWNLASPAEAAAWLQNTPLSSNVKSDLRLAAQH
jgi:RNA polymerase sigma-70 factor (ECF subfamily)